MLYYKVPESLDGKKIINPNKKNWDRFELVANELYTKTECKQRGIPLGWLDLVNIKKTETYFFFGARFN